jgi:hypothetical protein
LTVKESWNLQEHRPIIAWELPNSGLAFLQAAILGVFIGRRTFIMPPPPTSLLSATLYAAGTSPEATEALKQSMQKSRQ